MRRSLPVILLLLGSLVLVEAKQQWVRRCKRSTAFMDLVKGPTNPHGCSKNIWLAMDRASKCPQLNGAASSVPLVEASVQPRLYGRSGKYSANCEYMVIVVEAKGCVLLETDDIEFKCRNNLIFYKGRRVTSFQRTAPESSHLEHVQRREEQLKREFIEPRRRLEKLEEEGRQLKERIEKETLEKQEVLKEWNEPIPILVFACNRPLAIRDHIRKLLDLRPNEEQFPIFVSQDCGDESVTEQVETFGDKVHYIQHLFDAKIKGAYNRIARHYKLALDYIFLKEGYTSVIITEDDLDIAVDFFSFFANTRYLLEVDPTLWCVTAWNDNGNPENIDTGATAMLYRSDFLAGLGWMMTLKTWKELGPVWPDGYWDDWMRDPVQRKGRQCIRPEVSRTGMTDHGRRGASQGLYFDKYLARVKLNDVYTDFEKVDMNYLLPENYKKKVQREVMEQAEPLEFHELDPFVSNPENRGKSVRIMYTDQSDFASKAEVLGLMTDFRGGVPRTAYDGIVTCFLKGVRVHLVPDRSRMLP